MAVQATAAKEMYTQIMAFRLRALEDAKIRTAEICVMFDNGSGVLTGSIHTAYPKLAQL